ncbi:pyrroloquinoline quinone biosynthesis protein PqqE [Kitasatospora sp. NPDC050543]|uniref:pyrroloquinoline quinone biosynthesis protein PqqE n=1 Tax=Kitasatospora sp. NPDC050543 TaxID=3364054 RepID=UPI003791D12D
MSEAAGGCRPHLRRGVRLVHDPVRDRPALLYPEGVLLLNDSAAAVLLACDGRRGTAEVTTALGEAYEGVDPEEVRALLTDLAGRRLLTLDGTGGPAAPAQNTGPPLQLPPQAPQPAPQRKPQRHPKPGTSAPGTSAPAPLGLIAELTYRCPLHCTYCANPVALDGYREELETGDWRRVLEQARALGVLQVHLSGGEPLLRRDLVALVGHAHRLGMYTNLVTSGIPLEEARVAALAEAGLDHVQLSLQDADTRSADAVAGLRAHERKLAAAALLTGRGLPLTVNAVLHRGNLARLPAIADLAVEMGADRVELAHTQFYGWAWRNRAHLTPTAEQVEQAARAVAEARDRHGARIEIVHVAADHLGGTAKPCMNGWGTRQLVVAPNGDVLPCLAAAQLPDLQVPSARREHLDTIWYGSSAFNRFRGTDWMPQPCRGCALREVDFGGCRCQAYQLTGDPAATDPACSLSPHHRPLTTAAAPAGPTDAPAVPRRMR